MSARVLLGGFALLVFTQAGRAQTPEFQVPRTVTAGSAFSIGTTGSGKATLYLAGPGGALRREVALGSAVSFAPGELYGAGRYMAILDAGGATRTASLDVTPADRPASIGFLARPSRLPVGLRGGITGTAYLFDAYRNLLTATMPVAFQLSAPAGPSQAHTVTTRNGAAWTSMDSQTKQGHTRFTAQAGGVTDVRVIDEVPGDPCSISMSAHPNGPRVELTTAPVRDCGGNPVPDGTVVTFTETAPGVQSTVDAPLKQGIARATMPLLPGARIAVASGVIAGNEIRLGGER